MLNRLAGLFRRSRLEHDLDEEIQLHIELKTQENIAAGMPPEEARYAALRAFGGVEQKKEQCRDADHLRWLEDILQDLRYGLRQLRRNPGFTIVAVITLALGIGANTAMFSLTYTLLLRSLPFYRPDRIALVQNALVQGSFPPHDTAKQFHRWARHSMYLADAALFEGIDRNLGGPHAGGAYIALCAMCAGQTGMFLRKGTSSLVPKSEILPDSQTLYRGERVAAHRGRVRGLFRSGAFTTPYYELAA